MRPMAQASRHRLAPFLPAMKIERSLSWAGLTELRTAEIRRACIVVPIEQIQTVSFAAMYTRRGHMLDWRELSG